MREVRVPGRAVRLTEKEFGLLWTLPQRPGRVFTASELMRAVWGYEPAIDTRTLSVHLARLRSKLGDAVGARPVVDTIHGAGYRFVPPTRSHEERPRRLRAAPA